MSDALELSNSRVGHIEWLDGILRIHFSQAYIHKSKGQPGRDPAMAWSQEAELILLDAVASGPLPPLPNTIAEGYLEVGGIMHALIPLPFKRKVEARLHLEFTDGSLIDIAGRRPRVELLGTPIFLEGPA
ncbi:MAG TPA: hypothetical protein VGD18_05475 [Thiobacillaceae bacterium]